MKKIISWKKFEALISDSENLQKSVTLIKVDSRKRSVGLVKVDNFNYGNIYDLLGHGCRSYESPFAYNNGDTLYTDEEFLVREFDLEVDEGGMYNPIEFGFVMVPFSMREILWGNGVIIGCDDEGESDDVKGILDDMRKDILFVSRENKILKVWQWNVGFNRYMRVK